MRQHMYQCCPGNGGFKADTIFQQSMHVLNVCIQFKVSVPNIRDPNMVNTLFADVTGPQPWCYCRGTHIVGILLKGPYLPCVSMAGRALWQDTIDVLSEINFARQVSTRFHIHALSCEYHRYMWYFDTCGFAISAHQCIKPLRGPFLFLIFIINTFYW